FTCNICQQKDSVPNKNYFLPEKMQEITQLNNSSFDMITTSDYLLDPPMAPTYFFLIDVSQEAQKSGMLNIICDSLKEIIIQDKLQGGVRKQIGIITYDSQIHIYNLKSNLKQAQMYVLPDFKDGELFPLQLENLVVTIEDSKDIIVDLLDNLPNMLQNQYINNNTSCFIYALDVFFYIEYIKDQFYFIFIKFLQGCFQNAQKQWRPSSKHFKILSKEMIKICPLLFVFSQEFKNLITLGELPRILNGEIYFYHDQEQRQKQFKEDLLYNLQKSFNWENNLKIRISPGFKIKSINGSFALKSKDQFVFPCDLRKPLLLDLEIEENQSQQNNIEVFSIQTELLYTNNEGQRLLRFHNYVIPLSSSLQQIYDSIDLEAYFFCLSKRIIENLYYYNINEIKTMLITEVKKLNYQAKITEKVILSQNEQIFKKLKKKEQIINK
ncbi:sec23 sec24 trunk domain protein, partial [Ichthyophthirius multifiliis]